jgi:L-threonylcarbamoyladenylate synthase
VPAAGTGSVAAAAEALRAGGVVVLPTDTVYGLAAALDHPEAVARLSVLKERPRGVPIAVLVTGVEQAAALGVLGEQAAALAEAHWPGALTMVVDAVPGVAAVIGSDDASVGIRAPDHAVLQALAAEVGPLATTSANRHGEATPTTLAEVLDQLGEVDAAIDGGACEGVPSTVVDVRVDPPVVLRQGEVVVQSRAATKPPG